MKRIVLTGGGTAGHVTPNIALIPRLRELNYDICYIGSYDGIEKKLIEEFHIPYYGISSGKLRRYFDPKNFSDPFKVLKGIGESPPYSEGTEAGYCLFQRRLCLCSRCSGSQTASHPGDHSRVGSDPWSCQ